MKETARAFFEVLQDVICSKLEAVDGGAKFKEDSWRHHASGGGRTRILERGDIFEKAGVNFSAITSELSPLMAERLKVGKQTVFATGVSLVLHPSSPMIPTVHANFRYLELENGDGWFGGGTDLTPWYFFEEDARHFHGCLKAACDRHNPEFYPRFKKWCDEYFTIKHRNETRGIGGIFFDYLREEREQTFAFVKDAGLAFLGAYVPIVEMRRDEKWTEQQKLWQLVRRGRYVEFNLVYDRGTLFGLETGGRVESILMSLPPEVRWEYNFTPAPGSREEALVQILQHPREWVSFRFNLIDHGQ